MFLYRDRFFNRLILSMEPGSDTIVGFYAINVAEITKHFVESNSNMAIKRIKSNKINTREKIPNRYPCSLAFRAP